MTKSSEGITVKLSRRSVESLGPLITGNATLSVYRSGPELVRFFNEHGLNDDYNSGFGSRWAYAIDALERLNGTNAMSGVISSALDPRDFLNTDFDIEAAVDYVNTFLHFDGYCVAKDGPYYICRKISGISSSNVAKVKNLIFAANGPKPEIVLRDAVDNTIQIVKNEEFCLVYEEPIPETGLMWHDLVRWWIGLCGMDESQFADAERQLYSRLRKSLVGSPPEQLFFKSYFMAFREPLADKFPALIPQVYLHYDPYTLAQLSGRKRIPRQRMDFLLLTEHARVVLEIDGKQHYSELNNQNIPVAQASKYAEMVAEDRNLKLAGYEVFRFGGYELQNENDSLSLVRDFFNRLLDP